MKIALMGLLAGSALFATTTAHAQYRSFVTSDAGWYWRLDGGGSIPQDGHISDFGGFSTGQKVSYDTGFAFNGGFGYFYNKFVATELELGSTWNYLSSVEGADVHDTSFGTAP